MVEEVRMFKANDGKLYKTSSGAENHNKKIAADEVKESLGLDRQEIDVMLRKVAKSHSAIEFLLKSNPDWTTWSPHQIKWIDEELLNSMNIKKTLYVIEERTYGFGAGVEEKVLFTEEGENFADPELHVGDGYDEYRVEKIEDVNELTRKVFYKDKYSYEEVIEMKLDNKERLTDGEISTLIYEYNEVYRVEGEDSRWSRSILSVIDLNDKLYAIDWQEGLTENQENEFFSQPYEVTLSEEEVTITKTIINKVQ